MKCFNPPIYDIEHLMQFYKRIFCLFHWQFNLPASVDRKMTQISYFLRKLTFLWLLLNFLICVCIVHSFNCGSRDRKNNDGYFVWFTVVNTWSIVLSLSPLIFQFDNFKNVWFELQCLDILILKRLGHQINYYKFRRSFTLSSIFCALFSIAFVISRLIFIRGFSPSWFRILICILRIMQLYIGLHTIFIISLSLFIHKMFSKYVNFAYHLSRSHLLFPNVNTIDQNIRFYKEIHYKIWTITCELSDIFGMSNIVILCQAFFDITHTLFFIFYTWESGYISRTYGTLSSIYTVKNSYNT